MKLNSMASAPRNGIEIEALTVTDYWWKVSYEPTVNFTGFVWKKNGENNRFHEEYFKAWRPIPDSDLLAMKAIEGVGRV